MVRGRNPHGPAGLRYRAFAEHPHGGNPAGIVLDAAGATDAQMQQVAAAVRYAETVFVTAEDGDGFGVRYFSPVGDGGIRVSGGAVRISAPELHTS